MNVNVSISLSINNPPVKTIEPTDNIVLVSDE